MSVSTLWTQLYNAADGPEKQAKFTEFYRALVQLHLRVQDNQMHRQVQDIALFKRRIEAMTAALALFDSFKDRYHQEIDDLCVESEQKLSLAYKDPVATAAVQQAQQARSQISIQEFDSSLKQYELLEAQANELEPVDAQEMVVD